MQGYFKAMTKSNMQHGGYLPLFLRSLATNNGVTVERMIGIYCGTKRYQFDNVTVIPVHEFINELYNGKIF
jgi:hypothetical protein